MYRVSRGCGISFGLSSGANDDSIAGLVPDAMQDWYPVGDAINNIPADDGWRVTCKRDRLSPLVNQVRHVLFPAHLGGQSYHSAQEVLPPKAHFLWRNPHQRTRRDIFSTHLSHAATLSRLKTDGHNPFQIKMPQTYLRQQTSRNITESARLHPTLFPFHHRDVSRE